MKINERYEIRVCVIQLVNAGCPGDCYDNFETFKKEHPFSPYKFGFIVFDTYTGFVPDECNDWNDSPEEAMMDYEENCKGD